MIQYKDTSFGVRDSKTESKNLLTKHSCVEQYVLPSTTSTPTVKFLTLKKIVHKYGLTKSDLHWHLINIFHLPPQCIDATNNYFILHYTGRQFTNRLTDGTIAITSDTDTKRYSVVYDNCTPVTAKKAQAVILSFRNAKEEIGIPYNYVIVRIAVESRLES